MNEKLERSPTVSYFSIASSSPEEMDEFLKCERKKFNENLKEFCGVVELKRTICFFHPNRFCDTHEEQQMIFFDTIYYHNKQLNYKFLIDLCQCPICKCKKAYILEDEEDVN
jgi:hypothetical protein